MKPERIDTDERKLATRLKDWTAEFRESVDETFCVPAALWTFLAQRLVESCPERDRPNNSTVRAQIGETMRTVRIRGLRSGRLLYEHADGTIGFGLTSPLNVHRDDQPKLAAMLDRIEGEEG